MELDWWIWRCDHYMIIFGLGIPAKHGQVGQAKPGFPHFADVDVKWLHYKCNKRYTELGVKLPLEYYLNYGLFD